MRLHIDCFSTSLEDLPVADKKDIRKVFDVIVDNGRFSTFDIDSHLAKPVTELFQKGLLKSDPNVGYPWTAVIVTPRGWEWRHGKIDTCTACGGLGYITKMMTKRTAFAAPCTACNSTGFAEVESKP